MSSKLTNRQNFGIYRVLNSHFEVALGNQKAAIQERLLWSSSGTHLIEVAAKQLTIDLLHQCQVSGVQI